MNLVDLMLERNNVKRPIIKRELSDFEKFKGFLIAEGVWLAYLDNLKRAHGNKSYFDFFKESKPDKFINGAFYWPSTIEGSSYWNHIDILWLGELKR